MVNLLFLMTMSFFALRWLAQNLRTQYLPAQFMVGMFLKTVPVYRAYFSPVRSI